MSGQSTLAGDEARAALLRGIDLIAATVAPTLGPTPGTVAISPIAGSGPPEVLDRAATITRRLIALDHPFENMGAMLIRHLVWRVHEEVGDGGATAAVIARRLIADGTAYIVAGGDDLALQRGIQRAAEAVRSELKSLARPVELPREIAAMIAGTIRDERTALLIGEALDAVGPDGVIQVRDGQGTRTEVEYIAGVRWDGGVASPYLIDETRDTETLDNPLILVADSAVTSANEVLPAIECALAAERPLLIIAPEIGDAALATLVANRSRGLLAAKAPAPVGQRERAIEEIALITGARLICQARGDRLRDVQLPDFGAARQAWATRGMTGLIGARGDRTATRARLTEVQIELDRATDDDARNKIRERIGRLAGIAAIIRVGGTTAHQRNEIEQRVEAAVANGRAALAGGAVPGGGCALIAAGRAVACLSLEGDEAVGARLLLRALEEPLRTLVRNGGRDPGLVIHDARQFGGQRVFDATGGDWVNPWQSGILDARLVLDRVIETIVSSAGTTLRTETLVRVPDPAMTWTP